MIINKPKQEAREVSFYELPIGAGFRCQNRYYIKTETCQCKDDKRNCNAIQLETGLVAHFIQNDLVEKIPMIIEVLE